MSRTPILDTTIREPSRGAAPPQQFPTSLQPVSTKASPVVTYSTDTTPREPLFPVFHQKPKLPSDSDVHILLTYLTETEEYQRASITSHKKLTTAKTQKHEKTRKKRFDLSKDLALTDALPVWIKLPSLLASSFTAVQGAALAATNPLAGGVMMLSGTFSTLGTVAGDSNFKKLGYLAVVLSAAGASSTLLTGANTPVSFTTLKDAAYGFISTVSGLGSMKQAIFQSRKASKEGEAVVLDAQLDKESKEIFSASGFKRIASLEQAAAEILSNWVRDQAEIKREMNRAIQGY